MSHIWKWTKRITMGLVSAVFLLTVTAYTAGTFAKRQLVHEHMPPGQLTKVGSYIMHIFCMGEGSPTVILEAGLNDFYVSWSSVQPQVARVTRVCSYDRAGLGWSDSSPYPRQREVMAEELHTLLKNTGIEGPYVLVGHSFGGILMRTFARHYPDEVMGMVLVDSAHEQQLKRLPFLRERAVEFAGQFRTLSVMSTFGLIALSPATIPNPGLPEEAYKQYQAVLATTDYFDRAIVESLAFYSGDSPVNMFDLGDLPLIVLSHGRPDTTRGFDDATQSTFEEEWSKMQIELIGLSSNSQQIIAQTSGHYIQLDQPDLVVKSILGMAGPGQSGN